MEENKLTKKQQEVLDYIIKFKNKYGIPPTNREIGKALGKSSSGTVHAFLNILSDKGYIKYQKNKARTIVVLRSSDDE